MDRKPTWVAAHPLVPDLVVLGTAEHGAWLWDLAQGRPERLAGNTSWVTKARFHPKGWFILVARLDGTLSVHDCEGGVHGRFDPGHGRITDVAWAPDGRSFLTAGDDGMVRWWDQETLQKQDERGNPGTGVSSLALVDDVLAVGWEKGGMTGWIEDGPFTLTGPFRREVTAAASHPDHNLVAFGGMVGNLAVVDASTWEFARKYLGTPPRQIAVNSIAWSMLGTHFLAACSDGAARLVDHKSGSLVARELGKPFWLVSPKPAWDESMIVSCACWAGEQMYTVQFDGFLRRWSEPGPEADQSWDLSEMLA